jgi:hypothetical protein
VYSRWTISEVSEMLTPLSRKKLVVARKKEAIKCPRYDYVMDFVEAYRPYGDEADDFDG